MGRSIGGFFALISFNTSFFPFSLFPFFLLTRNFIRLNSCKFERAVFVLSLFRAFVMKKSPTAATSQLPCNDPPSSRTSSTMTRRSLSAIAFSGACIVAALSASLFAAENEAVSPAGGAAGGSRSVLQHLVVRRQADRRLAAALDRPDQRHVQHGPHRRQAVSHHGPAARRRAGDEADGRARVADSHDL